MNPDEALEKVGLGLFLNELWSGLIELGMSHDAPQAGNENGKRGSMCEDAVLKSCGGTMEQ